MDTDLDIQHGHGHAEWTLTWSMNMDIQHGHGNAAWTWKCNMDMDIQLVLGHRHGHRQQHCWTGAKAVIFARKFVSKCIDRKIQAFRVITKARNYRSRRDYRIGSTTLYSGIKCISKSSTTAPYPMVRSHSPCSFRSPKASPWSRPGTTS
jgi:hypothetical protein